MTAFVGDFKRYKLSLVIIHLQPIQVHGNTTSVLLLTFIAAGYMVAPSSKHPFLNIKTPVLFIQVPGQPNTKQPQCVSIARGKTDRVVYTMLPERGESRMCE